MPVAQSISTLIWLWGEIIQELYQLSLEGKLFASGPF